MKQQTSFQWEPLDERHSAISAAQPLEVELRSAAGRQLCLTCLNGAFPEGELMLILSNWSELQHWSVPARREGDRLVADISGTEQAFDPKDPRPLLLMLAQKTEKGFVQYPLRAKRFLPRTTKKVRCSYLYDERDFFGDPVDSFCVGTILYEVLPRFVRLDKTRMSLSLWCLPRSLRYWEQMCYGIREMSVHHDRIQLAIEAPEGCGPLEGVSIHLANGDESTQKSFPAVQKQGMSWAEIPVQALPADGQDYQLSGLLSGENGVLFHVSLSILNPEAHEAMEELANGVPLCRAAEGLNCYLTIDNRCHPGFRSGETSKIGVLVQEGVTLRELVEREELINEGHCAVRDLGGEHWKWRFEIPNVTISPEEKVELFAQRQGESAWLGVRVLSNEQGNTRMEADLSWFAQNLQNGLVNRWTLFLIVEKDGIRRNLRLRIPKRMVRRNLDRTSPFRDVSFSCSQPIGEAELNGNKIIAVICSSGGGFCQLQTCDEVRRYERLVTCRTEVARVRGTHLQMKVRCPDSVKGKWKGIALVYRYRLELDRQIHFIPADKIVQKDGYTFMSVDADLSRFTLSQLYWDIRMVFEGADGVSYLTRVTELGRRKDPAWKKAIRSLGRKAERVFFSGSYRQDADLSVSLYRAAGGYHALVCQDYSPYSGFAFRMKERVALIIAKLFRKPLASKSIYLCYEKYCCMAQDNGYYFFRYCMENDMERKMNRSIYFVIDKKQPDYAERLLPYKDHVIQFMSLKHMVYILSARLLISSDSKVHGYAWRAKESVILPRVLNRKKLVFLQHGVIALKRVGFYSKGSNAVNLFVTSNQREHDIIVDEMAYPSEDVIITGLARWDVLEDKHLQERHILVMPTWRNWLEEVSDAVFTASDYYREYMSLLNDPRLEQMLERQDLYLDFYIHPKFREYMGNFTLSGNKRVRLIPFGSEPLNQLIMGCKMLVTDYSSVCWDVYYQGKPVVFYQFDVDKYNETTGAYIDLETELFGERVMRADQLIGKLEEYAKNNFALPQVYADMRPQMYAYIDHNNSQRTCEEIMKRNW